ncbi:MAG TPA: MFS transporter [Gaiellaceae bacterium]|nr:MFS transporter [Gaiellaceae bacterium]
MYQIEGSRAVLRVRAVLLAGRLPRVGRNVVLLGLVSMFTDVSSEMVATILPLYVVYSLGLSPLAYGVIDGAYQGGVAIVRLASGFVADRLGRYKEMAALGYTVSAATRLLFLGAGSSIGALTALVVADRVGKGIRTAPRDALISLSCERQLLATAFGVHRALDTAGAMLGPLVAFGILLIAPLAFDAIFIVSFCFALIGLAILALFVENRRAPAARAPNASASEPERAPVSLRAAAGLLRVRRFRALTLAGVALGLMTLSDGFVYITLQRRLDFDVRYLPLLFVATALCYMVAAIPIGRLADRAGRDRVFLGGYALLLLLYLSLLLPAFGTPELLLLLAGLGLYYAATDGVLMALASAVLPADFRASGLALLVAATSTSRLAASILFGALWTWQSLDVALVVFSCGLAAALPLVALVLRRGREPAG